MAKQRFKIPTTLDVTYFDMEFNLKSKNGVGITKPVKAKVVLFTLLAIFGWFYLTFQSFISAGGIPVIIGFSIFWIILSIILVKSDKTQRMGLELVMSLGNYLPKSARHVATRLSDPVNPMKRLTSIDTVDPEDGMLHFLDGHVGYCYHIVGTASALMFEADKQHILDKVDSFYRKMPVGAEVIYDTVYEGHVVDEQLEAVVRTKANLNIRSRGLEKLLTERHDILKYAINDKNGIMSLHQYLVVRAPNEQVLIEITNLIDGDVNGDGQMFRLAKPLKYKEVERYLKSLLTHKHNHK